MTSDEVHALRSVCVRIEQLTDWLRDALDDAGSEVFHDRMTRRLRLMEAQIGTLAEGLQPTEKREKGRCDISSQRHVRRGVSSSRS